MTKQNTTTSKYYGMVNLSYLKSFRTAHRAGRTRRRDQRGQRRKRQLFGDGIPQQLADLPFGRRAISAFGTPHRFEQHRPHGGRLRDGQLLVRQPLHARRKLPRGRIVELRQQTARVVVLGRGRAVESHEREIHEPQNLRQPRPESQHRHHRQLQLRAEPDPQHVQVPDDVRRNHGRRAHVAGQPRPQMADDAQTQHRRRTGFLQNRINLEFNYYSNTTDNNITRVDILPSTGFSSYTANQGDVSNKGFDFNLSVTPVRTKEWQLNLFVNGQHNRNKLTNLSEALKDYNKQIMEQQTTTDKTKIENVFLFEGGQIAHGDLRRAVGRHRPRHGSGDIHHQGRQAHLHVELGGSGGRGRHGPT